MSMSEGGYQSYYDDEEDNNVTNELDQREHYLTNALASYIADYVNEELSRSHKITEQTIADAIDAFDGGAR